MKIKPEAVPAAHGYLRVGGDDVIEIEALDGDRAGDAVDHGRMAFGQHAMLAFALRMRRLPGFFLGARRLRARPRLRTCAHGFRPRLFASACPLIRFGHRPSIGMRT
ncbi:hypothetical protein RFM41_12500 [Mesorhizobium sp. VK25A]|uniref:Uncharacterized protein n=1 Tax=Mesorhizobium vachelliae TaxID=3072309 RepID=A0ABU5A9Q2_9HYPH|nr:MULTISPECIES: hypothetical protein [unclassified Mesorhizobium]MDX8532933.1 hypothetical protein [Mesorhizobium sp. VK25D]MDX8544561.1 hypothetical protein [Mesorhizobium sp. VK25A]